MMQEAVRKGAVAFLLFVVLFFSACGGNKPEPRLITVTGEAEVRVAPNEAIITLGVETWDKDLAIAKRHNDERIKNVLAVAKQYDITPANVRIDNITIEPQYTAGDAQEGSIGYTVRKTIVLTVRDVSKFDSLLNSAIVAGANYVSGVQFRTTKVREYRKEARSLALKAAKEKAKVMAKALKQKIGRPYAIVEEQHEWGMIPNVIQGNGGSLEEADKIIATGQISVSARVKVSFELR